MRLISSLQNSLFVYARLLFTAVSSITGVALLYRSLGIETFGQLSLIIATIALANFLNIALSTTSQRFLAMSTPDNEFEQKGLDNLINIKFIIVSVMMYILLSNVGWSYFERVYGDYNDIKVLKYSFVILVIGASITNLHSRFVVRLIAYENFQLFAKISVLDAVIKLFVASLVFLLEDFQLIEYAYGLLLNSVFIFFVYLLTFVSKNTKIIEMRLPTKQLSLHFTKFLFWTLFGSASSAVRIQGITLALGAFFTSSTVSARAIGLQAANSSRTLSQNLNVVLYPSLLKAFSLNEHDRWNLLHTSCKFTFYLTFILVCPMLFYADDVLFLWLGSYTPLTKSFVSLMLLEVLIFSVSLPLTSVARASDHIGTYELHLGITQFSLVPIAIFAIILTREPTSVVYAAILVNIFMLIQRIAFLKRYMNLELIDFWSNCLRYVFIIIILCTLMMIALYYLDIGIFYGTAAFLIFSSPSIYMVGLNSDERLALTSVLISKLRKKNGM